MPSLFAHRKPDRQLRIWLFNPYGPLPDEGWRDYSYVAIGGALAEAGHHVTWWTSNFSHHFKRFRSEGWEERQLGTGMRIRLVPSPGYRSNIGVGRLVRDLVYGLRAYRAALREPPADVIITSEPATMAGYAGARLARKTNAALIYDQMDLWPELMVDMLPRALRQFGHALFFPIYRLRSRLFGRLDGAMALAKPYLDSILRELPAQRSIPQLIVYNGIDVPAFRSAMGSVLPPHLRGHFRRAGLKAIFAGSLGPSYDIDGMVRAAELLASRRSMTTIFIAGDGPRRREVESAATQCTNLVYLGTLDPAVLPSVYAQCDVGLAAYSARSNVEMCDKFYDYTAAGLVIVNSLCGEVKDWVVGAGLGFQYAPGNATELADRLDGIAADAASTARYKAASWDIGMHFDRAAQHAIIPDWVRTVLDSAGRAPDQASIHR